MTAPLEMPATWPTLIWAQACSPRRSVTLCGGRSALCVLSRKPTQRCPQEAEGRRVTVLSDRLGRSRLQHRLRAMLVPQAARADPMADMRSEGAEVAITRALPLPRSCKR